jgi:branched-chain amino acid transport system ATP-binding protein
MLEIADVTVRYGGVTPLDDVSIRFDGGVCGLIGPNGAGKTTLLNLLSGFARASAGSIICDETDLLRMAPHRRARWGLRRTFQTEQVVPSLSVRDNVIVSLEHGRSRDGDGITPERALELVGLQELTHAPASHLTSAERRLLEIARASVGKPRVILLDEPGAGLTSAESIQLRGIIGELARLSTALVVLIDHDIELVRAICETTAVLDFGRVIASGNTLSVLDDAAVRRAYLGEEPVAA